MAETNIEKCWNCGEKITPCTIPSCPMPVCLGWRHLDHLNHLCEFSTDFYASPLKQYKKYGVRYVDDKPWKNPQPKQDGEQMALCPECRNPDVSVTGMANELVYLCPNCGFDSLHVRPKGA